MNDQTRKENQRGRPQGGREENIKPEEEKKLCSSTELLFLEGVRREHAQEEKKKENYSGRSQGGREENTKAEKKLCSSREYCFWREGYFWRERGESMRITGSVLVQYLQLELLFKEPLDYIQWCSHIKSSFRGSCQSLAYNPIAHNDWANSLAQPMVAVLLYDLLQSPSWFLEQIMQNIKGAQRPQSNPVLIGFTPNLRTSTF